MRRSHVSLWIAAIPALSAAGAAHGQTAPPSHVQEMMEEERHLVHPSQHRDDCPAEDPLNKAIVVCAPDTSQRYRVPPASDDAKSRAGTRGGSLSPPDVYGGASCDRGASVAAMLRRRSITSTCRKSPKRRPAAMPTRSPRARCGHPDHAQPAKEKGVSARCGNALSLLAGKADQMWIGLPQAIAASLIASEWVG
jgi:hypothetical protein